MRISDWSSDVCSSDLIRSGVNMAMRMMGEQFVTGETIAEALKRARAQEARGFTYSYDMLGEAAMTMADAERYYRDYDAAIDRKSDVSGKGVSVRVDLGGRRIIKKKKITNSTYK